MTGVPQAMSSTRSTSLDSVDRQILGELQQDGRMTNVELASRVQLSAPPCLRRVRRLEDAGVIRGYHADLDPVALGWEVTFFALVGLETQMIGSGLFNATCPPSPSASAMRSA